MSASCPGDGALVKSRGFPKSSILVRSTLKFRGGKSVIKIESEEQFDELLASAAENELFVLDFSAEWCMPCKMVCYQKKIIFRSNSFS